MHRIDSDLVDTLADGAPVRWSRDPSVCVVMAAYGYPGPVRTGDRIEGVENCSGVVFQAGTRAAAGGIETAAGRVLGVTASGADLRQAIASVYCDVARIRFDGMQFRSDIGKKGLARW
jgi:phosphoribosylamine--glycine ligase